MRTVLLATCLLLLAIPAHAAERPSEPDGLPDLEEVERDGVKNKAGKKKKKKKGKRGKPAEPETPPPPPPDGDGDGVPDADDGCPEVAEDSDGFEDSDGCPETDNDADGIPDLEDECPDEAETVDDWADTDGCPEEDPEITPIAMTAELVDGTKISGTIIRIIAVDEDEPETKPGQTSAVDIIVSDEHELATSWSNLRSMRSESVRFTDAVDCYSEGIQELGEAPTWECTLKHPTVLTLATSEKRGKTLFLDRKMRRLDLQIRDLVCEGTCEDLEDNTLSIYPYKLIAFIKNEDEHAAVVDLQTRLRATQQRQIKKATFEPVGE